MQRKGTLSHCPIAWTSLVQKENSPGMSRFVFRQYTLPR